MVGCKECGYEFRTTVCPCCFAQEMLEEFLDAMPEIEFRIGPAHEHEERIVKECYGGNVRDYFIHSWTNFLDVI